VNIGIGGSDLGPAMACEALGAFAHPRLRTHFVSNVDGARSSPGAVGCAGRDDAVRGRVSKTFTDRRRRSPTARSARDWLLREPGVSPADVARHFVAVSTNAREVEAFGIDPRHMFGFWDWVGGRYSLWSAVGLSLMLSIGADAFDDLLAGAPRDGRAFRAGADRVQPAGAAWRCWVSGTGNFLGCDSHAVLPYAPGPRAACPPTCSSLRWRATASR
jgi:glucose-6-phosphate isomerase